MFNRSRESGQEAAAACLVSIVWVWGRLYVNSGSSKRPMMDVV